MALPLNRPLSDENTVSAFTLSAATTPVVGNAVAYKKGNIVRATAVTTGAFTGTLTVTVASPAGTVGTVVLPAGTSVAGITDFGAMAPNSDVLEGDKITFTCSGGTGDTIPAVFTAVIR